MPAGRYRLRLTSPQYGTAFFGPWVLGAEQELHIGSPQFAKPGHVAVRLHTATGKLSDLRGVPVRRCGDTWQAIAHLKALRARYT